MLNFLAICTGTKIRTRNSGFGDRYDTISPYPCLLPICQRSFRSPGEARTHNPMVKSHVLYPFELQGNIRSLLLQRDYYLRFRFINFIKFTIFLCAFFLTAFLILEINPLLWYEYDSQNLCIAFISSFSLPLPIILIWAFLLR